LKKNDLVNFEIRMNDGFKSKDFIKELVETVDGFIDNSQFENSEELKQNNSKLLSDSHGGVDYVQVKGEITNISVDSILIHMLDVKIGFIADKIDISTQDIKDLMENIADLPSVKAIDNIAINKKKDLVITDDITDFISKKPIIPPKMPTTRQPLSNK
jgi:hypothetical protein